MKAGDKCVISSMIEHARVNWDAISKYAPLVDHVNTRDDLNYIIGEMIGELNCGHAYVNGGDRPSLNV